MSYASRARGWMIFIYIIFTLIFMTEAYKENDPRFTPKTWKKLRVIYSFALAIPILGFVSCAKRSRKVLIAAFITDVIITIFLVIVHTVCKVQKVGRVPPKNVSLVIADILFLVIRSLFVRWYYNRLKKDEDELKNAPVYGEHNPQQGGNVPQQPYVHQPPMQHPPMQHPSMAQQYQQPMQHPSMPPQHYQQPPMQPVPFGYQQPYAQQPR